MCVVCVYVCVVCMCVCGCGCVSNSSALKNLTHSWKATCTGHI